MASIPGSYRFRGSTADSHVLKIVRFSVVAIGTFAVAAVWYACIIYDSSLLTSSEAGADVATTPGSLPAGDYVYAISDQFNTAAPGDPTVVEKLTKYAAAKRSYSYDIVKVDPKVLPVVNYHSTITVSANGHGSKVVWSGNFDPPPGGDENASAKAVVGVYRAGLDNIKATTEK